MKNAMFGLSEWFCKKLQNFVLSKSVQTAFCKPREVEESKPNKQTWYYVKTDNLHLTCQADVKLRDVNSLSVTKS